MKKNKTILVAAAFLCIPIGIYVFQDTVQRDIESGELLYSNTIGWVNVGHAHPDRTRNAMNRLTTKAETATDSFDFTYSQQMKFRLPNGYLVAEYQQKRRIPPNLSGKELEQVFMEMFRSVSDSFETMQSLFPYNLIKGPGASSFKDGDLKGNLISLALSQSGDSLNHNSLMNDLNLRDISGSLEWYKKNDYASNKAWTITWQNELPPTPFAQKLYLLSMRLETIKYNPALSLIISGKSSTFFEKLP